MSNTPGAPSSRPEGGVREIAARFADAYDARNVDAVVDLFSDNGDWTLGPGMFAGKAAIRRVLDWDVRLSPNASSRPFGVGTVVHENVAVNERLLEQSIEGIRYTCRAVTVLELNEAGEIEHARSYYDRLAIFRTVAGSYPGVKGWFFRRIINFMVSQAEKGVERS
jgi:hypothetical protein